VAGIAFLCLYKVHKVYSHIRYAPFVALDILRGVFMGFLGIIRLFSECYKLAGGTGLIACAKYLCGALRLSDLDEKSSVFFEGDFYA